MDDPLLAALIAKLPASGSTWPMAKRTSWMRLVWSAFELVYDAQEGDSMELPYFISNSSMVDKLAPVAPPTQPVKPMASPFTFLVDREGYARRGDHSRILPTDVGGGVLYDERGESGDLGAIVWADESRGIPAGLQLDISPAF